MTTRAQRWRRRGTSTLTRHPQVGSVDDMYKTIYIRKGSESFWERGEKIAQSRNLSMANYLAKLIQADIYSNGHTVSDDQTPAELVADIKLKLDQLASAAGKGKGT